MSRRLPAHTGRQAAGYAPSIEEEARLKIRCRLVISAATELSRFVFNGEDPKEKRGLFR